MKIIFISIFDYFINYVYTSAFPYCSAKHFNISKRLSSDAIIKAIVDPLSLLSSFTFFKFAVGYSTNKYFTTSKNPLSDAYIRAVYPSLSFLFTSRTWSRCSAKTFIFSKMPYPVAANEISSSCWSAPLS